VTKIRFGKWQIDKNIVIAGAIAIVLLVALLIVAAIDFWGVYNIEHLDLIIFVGLMTIILLAAAVMVTVLSP